MNVQVSMTFQSSLTQLNISSTSIEEYAKTDCDAFGKPHCTYNQRTVWLLFILGLLLMFTNFRNVAVLGYILRRHWVNTDAICFTISVLNSIFGTAIVFRSLTHSLPNIWPHNQFEVSLKTYLKY